MRRRVFLRAATSAVTSAAALSSLGACAETPTRLPKTRRDAEGPFYPVVPIPLDNNLLSNDNFVGEPLLFSGRVLDPSGNPMANTRVEIWQCDGNSVYRHPRASSPATEDPAFRGFGASLSDTKGQFAFTTIVPVPYPGRPPHIHVKLKQGDKTTLTTQIYLHGFSGPDERKLTTSKAADTYEAHFDFVV